MMSFSSLWFWQNLEIFNFVILSISLKIKLKLIFYMYLITRDSIPNGNRGGGPPQDEVRQENSHISYCYLWRSCHNRHSLFIWLLHLLLEVVSKKEKFPVFRYLSFCILHPFLLLLQICGRL